MDDASKATLVDQFTSLTGIIRACSLSLLNFCCDCLFLSPIQLMHQFVLQAPLTIEQSSSWNPVVGTLK